MLQLQKWGDGGCALELGAPSSELREQVVGGEMLDHAGPNWATPARIGVPTRRRGEAVVARGLGVALRYVLKGFA